MHKHNFAASPKSLMSHFCIKEKKKSDQQVPIKQPPSQYEQSWCKLLAVVIQEQTIYNFAIFFLRKKKRKCYLWQFSSVRIFFAAAACVTLPANQKALDCATGRRGLFFFLLLLLLPNVMQSTTAVATLGDFSWHRQTKALFFGPWKCSSGRTLHRCWPKYGQRKRRASSLTLPAVGKYRRFGGTVGSTTRLEERWQIWVEGGGKKTWNS